VKCKNSEFAQTAVTAMTEHVCTRWG